MLRPQNPRPSTHAVQRIRRATLDSGGVPFAWRCRTRAGWLPVAPPQAGPVWSPANPSLDVSLRARSLAAAVLAVVVIVAPASANAATPAPQLSEGATEVQNLAPCLGRNVAEFDTADFLALGLSRPVAERAASVAADLRAVDHLLAVPGIGPGKLRVIKLANPDLCVTVPVVPPDPVDSCVSARQYDLNLLKTPARRDRLTDETVLSHEEVDRMAAAGPFGSVRLALSYLGIGEGVYRKLMNTDSPTLCVTPPGFETAAGVTYEWITSWLTDGLAVDRFALVVAKDTLTERDGSWAYIDRDDIVLRDGAPPIARADVHLLSDSWEGGGRTVWVSGPADRTPTPPDIATRQTVWHELEDGTFEPFYGARLDETADSLTVQVESTSWFTALRDWAWEGFRWIRGRSVGSPSCSGTPAPFGSRHTGALLSNAPGGLIGECTYGNASVPGAVGAIDRVRAEVSVYLRSTRRVEIKDPGQGDDFIASLVADVWERFGSRQVASFGSNTNLYLPPEAPFWNGGTLVAPASYGTYEITPGTAPTVASLFMQIAYDAVVSKVDEYVQDFLVAQGVPRDVLTRITTGALSSFVECGYNFYRSDVPTDVNALSTVTYQAFRTCTPAMFENIVLDYVDALQDHLASSRLSTVINALRRSVVSFKFLENIALSASVHDEVGKAVATGVAVVVDLLRIAAGDPQHALFTPAQRPTRLDTGQAIPAACVKDDGEGGYTVQRGCVVPPTPPGNSDHIVNVSNDPLAFVVHNGKNIGEFASGGDYQCAAQSLLVRFVKDRSFTQTYGSSAARLRCPEDVGGGRRNIPAADNILLRMSDGTAYFKNSSTLVGIEHVLDGGCFERLASDHFGYDYVTRAEVESALQDGWEIDDASAACR